MITNHFHKNFDIFVLPFIELVTPVYYVIRTKLLHAEDFCELRNYGVLVGYIFVGHPEIVCFMHELRYTENVHENVNS